MKICNRCGKEIDENQSEQSDGFNKGLIELHRHSQMFVPYSGRGVNTEKGFDSEKSFEAWGKMKQHPAIVFAGAQNLEIHFGNDYYRICHRCNDELIIVIGEFFGLEAKGREDVS